MRLGIRYTLVALAVLVILISLLLFLHSPPFASRQLDSGRGGPTDVGIHRDKLHGRLYQAPYSSRYRSPLDLMPEALRQAASALPVTVTAEEFRTQPGLRTGNPLIDTYGQNDVFLSGERGRGVTFVGPDKKASFALLKEFNVNVMASDLIPLNRMVPDSRFAGCADVTYDTQLPTASIIVPFYDEWPSVLLRTVYSIVNRTPRHLLQEILLVDDHSTLDELKEPLDQYIYDHFPRGLVRVLRMPRREGLIRARMRGWRESRGDVLVFFDSHMEVNVDWLQPLLAEIQKDRRTVAMSALDYISLETLEYVFYEDYVIRYGFDWRLVFFETFFREDQLGSTRLSARPGSTMVGAAFAMDRNYFGELGGYDTGMQVWGGGKSRDVLESMAVRGTVGSSALPLTWATSHAASPTPSPQGRRQIEVFNYKRAVMVWMDPEHRQFVYDHYPEMKELDVGDLSERYALKERLQCRNFTWYLDNVWPELLIYNRNVLGWGSLVNRQSEKCLDNYGYLFQAPADLFLVSCHSHYHTQGFSLTKSGLLRTSLQCVVVKEALPRARPHLEDCIIGPRDKWIHTNGQIIHVNSHLCLDEDDEAPIMMNCTAGKLSQQWSFTRPASS